MIDEEKINDLLKRLDKIFIHYLKTKDNLLIQDEEIVKDALKSNDKIFIQFIEMRASLLVLVECSGERNFSLRAKTILSTMAKKGLSQIDYEELKRYYDSNSRNPTWRQYFLQDFSNARDIYLHRNDDLSLFSYVIGLMGLVFSLISLYLSLDAICLIKISCPVAESIKQNVNHIFVSEVIIAFVLMAIAASRIVWGFFGRYFKTNKTRVDLFYRMISDHASLRHGCEPH